MGPMSSQSALSLQPSCCLSRWLGSLLPPALLLATLDGSVKHNPRSQIDPIHWKFICSVTQPPGALCSTRRIFYKLIPHNGLIWCPSSSQTQSRLAWGLPSSYYSNREQHQGVTLTKGTSSYNSLAGALDRVSPTWASTHIQYGVKKMPFNPAISILFYFK